MIDSENKVVSAFLSYKTVLIRVLLRLSVQPADVDDILQESLTRALLADRKKRLEFPKSYLYTVSRNLAFEENQRRSREVQNEIDEAVLESRGPLTDDAIHYRQMMDAFWEAMGTLPTAHRRAILLRRIYGLSHKEIAKKLGVSVSSIEKYFAQGIKRCQDIMARRGYGADRRREKVEVNGARRRAASKER